MRVGADEAVQLAVEALGGTTEQGGLARLDVPIGPMTTYRVGGRAAIFVDAHTAADLRAVAAASSDSGLPVLAVGRGSNMLVADSGFHGIAVGLVTLDDVIDIDVDRASVRASAGVSLPVIARKTAAAGLTGFEWAVGVPGSIGGAVRMNAGGHGSDMAASLASVTLIDLSAPAAVEETVPADALGLAFRSSRLGPSQIVLDAVLQLAAGDRETAEREISEIVRWRRANQPGGQNAGSVFVNPVPGEVSAGALVDAAGLRGHRVGSAVVSDKHANFIQADEGGSADDVRALIDVVRARVEADSGFRLRSEIQLIGFEPASAGEDA